MKVTALCIRLSLTGSLLLVAQLHFSHSLEDVFPQVDPNRQLHFAYETLTVSCEGLNGRTGWRVMRKIKGVDTICASTWETSTGPCEIKTAYPEIDSGEYWCEMKGMKRSNRVNITVSAASVILESPVLPVMEGDDVTLSCRKKQTPSNITAEFYKGGFFMGSSSTGEMTIHSVSTSDEGLYKCNISGAGESAESWLTVTELHKTPDSSPDRPPQLFLLLCICVTASVVTLLFFVSAIRCARRRTNSRDTSTICYVPETSSPLETVSGHNRKAGSTHDFITTPADEEVFGEISVAKWQEPTYALIKQPVAHEENEEVSEFEETSEAELQYAAITRPRNKEGPHCR
ncbi:low affinity immunoglobulin gamma Fc region receptor II-b-like [Anabas testudineus]|uniref:Immunoglobulin domain-containing protein n=1 Tax=Anabas testudineus TaxID=64144 RepID=A0AAQ6IUI3_ANATE|nr:low affinity immunoglobulin gamma Fc region receptor II-b-like [Anabas testudineus]